MPTYLAIFFHATGVPLTQGFYTVDEFVARCAAGRDSKELSWAILIHVPTRKVVHGFNTPRPSYDENRLTAEG